MTWAKSTQLTVSGMTCDSCAQAITKALKAKGNVEDVQVDIEKKSVLVFFKGELQTKDEEIKHIIEKLGYKVEGIEKK